MIERAEEPVREECVVSVVAREVPSVSTTVCFVLCEKWQEVKKKDY